MLDYSKPPYEDGNGSIQDFKGRTNLSPLSDRTQKLPNRDTLPIDPLNLSRKPTS